MTRRWRACKIFFICIGAIVLVFLLLPFYQMYERDRLSREIGADRTSVFTRLLVIRIALDVHADVHGCIPPATVTDEEGRELYSWRAALGSQVEDLDEWRTFDRTKDWQSPANTTMREIPISMGFGYRNSTSAKFLAITGTGTAFEPDRFCKLSDMPPDLIVLVEKSDSEIFWMQPGDIGLDEVMRRSGESCEQLFSPAGRGFQVLFADGKIEWLSGQTPVSEFAKCARVETATAEARKSLRSY